MDFYSAQALGKRLRKGETEEDWKGISTFTDRTEAVDVALTWPQIGSYVVTLNVAIRAEIHGRYSPGRHQSHWTLWGRPEDFLPTATGPGVSVNVLDALRSRR